MSDTDEALQSLSPERRKLLERGLGDWLTWRPPEIQNTVGPFDMGPFEAFDQRRQKLIGEFTIKLQEFDDDDIALISGPKSTGGVLPHRRRRVDPGPMARELRTIPADRAQILQHEWSSFTSKQRDRLAEVEPPWYAAGFGHSDHVADFEYWVLMPRYTVREITELSIGIEPGQFENYKGRDLFEIEPKSLPEPLRFLGLRFELLSRVFDPKKYLWRVRPDEFLDWVDKTKFEAHPEFLRLLQLQRASRQSENAAAPSRRTDRREIDSIAQLFTAMAIDVYGYRPEAAKNAATKDITNLAASMGLKVSEETVRKYLKLGASFLPEDWEPGDL